MGHGDARSCGRGDDRRNTGDNLEVEACTGEGERLLPTTPEDERVATFQTHDVAAALREMHQQLVDQLLRHRCTGTLADVDELGVRPGEREHAGADECVVHDHVGLLQTASTRVWSAAPGHPGRRRPMRSCSHRNHHGAGRRVGRFVDEDQATPFSTDFIRRGDDRLAQ